MSTKKSNALTINYQNPSVYIGMGNVIKGSIDVPGEITIDGTFEGDLKAKQLTVGKSGCVCGNTHAHTVIVHGRIDQKLVSTALINIYATGRITGDVIYYEIEIEKGGKLEGTLTRRNQSNE
jgi:cytoskeletal protein CcmA (bactofilin family)